MLKRHRLGGLPFLFAMAATTLACGSAAEDDDPVVWDMNGTGDKDKSKDAPGEESTPDGQAPDGQGDPNAPDPNVKGEENPGSCTSARDIGTVSGDTESVSVTNSGSAGTWVKFRVTESQSNPLGDDLNVRVRLTPPPSCDFDLYAFLNKDKDELACGGADTARSTNVGTAEETIDLSWGEGWAPNGADDSRTVVVEVRHLSGTCKAGDKWVLTVEGNPAN